METYEQYKKRFLKSGLKKGGYLTRETWNRYFKIPLAQRTGLKAGFLGRAFQSKGESFRELLRLIRRK